MEAGVVANRGLQLRAMDGLRQRLGAAVDAVSAPPSADSLTAADVEQLREIGGGRLGAVAIVVADAANLAEAARLIESNVRRTDLLLTQAEDTLLVLAPGLDPVGGQGLIARLEHLLHEFVPAPPVVGGAYRSPLSLTGWDMAQLADEARRRALNAASAEAVESVA